jgi:glycosyltransferase involved in cell wall biosynthesis
MNNEIAVLIPAHNEERAIVNLVRSLKKIYGTVIVVDDGSGDKTNLLARENGAVVLTHPACRGKGEALKTGFAYVLQHRIPAVITMDGDGQHLVSDIHNFERAYNRNKRVAIWVGTRKIKGTEMPVIRRLTNISMSIIISLMSGQWIPDTQSGFRLIKRELIERVPLCTSRFETESEILIKSGWHGYRISSVPISTVYSSEKSKINPVKDTMRFFRMLFIIIFPLLQRVRFAYPKGGRTSHPFKTLRGKSSTSSSPLTGRDSTFFAPPLRGGDEGEGETKEHLK